MTKKKDVAVQGDAAAQDEVTVFEEQPTKGGSYVRCPEKGTLTCVEGAGVEQASADELPVEPPLGDAGSEQKEA